MKLEGIFLPATTPFDANGDLYQAKLRHNFEKWNRTGVAGYIMCGATGEDVLLSPEEKLRLWAWAAEYAAPGKTLIAGAAAESVRETVTLANQAAGFGYKAAMVRTPSAGDRALYFRAVTDQAKIPVIVCNRPHPLPAETILELSRRPNIVAASLADSAATLYTSLMAGAAGAVLALANAAPYATIAIWEAVRTREYDAAEDWQNRIARAADLVATKHGIPGLKYAMDLNGYYGGPCRLPLCPVSPVAKADIEDAFRELKG